jgi:hypothetical protein
VVVVPGLVVVVVGVVVVVVRGGRVVVVGLVVVVRGGRVVVVRGGRVVVVVSRVVVVTSCVVVVAGSVIVVVVPTVVFGGEVLWTVAGGTDVVTVVVAEVAEASATVGVGGNVAGSELAVVPGLLRARVRTFGRGRRVRWGRAVVVVRCTPCVERVMLGPALVLGWPDVELG